jgi:hypothetical protein
MRDLVVAFALLRAASALDLEPRIFEGKTAITYYGSVTANIFVASTVSQFNYNGNTECPRTWDLGIIQGARLRLYPGVIDSSNVEPYPGLAQHGGLAMRVDLMAGHAASALSYNIDGIDLHDILITNGSTAGPFMNGGTPAVLAPDPARLVDGRWYAGNPVWTINGTEDAFVLDQYPQMLLQCENSRDRGYCGYFQDTRQNGCWAQQWFSFGMQEQPANFSIRFSNQEATFDLWIEGEYNSTGRNSVAHVVFTGYRDLPSVTDYGFWTQSPLNYEVEKGHVNAMSLESDYNHMPIFRNATDTLDWWSTANGTFRFESGAATLGMLVGSWVSLMCLVILISLVA